MFDDPTIDPKTILANALEANDFFDGFDEHQITVDGSSVFYRIGGNGPPLLLLHGYPQTSAMWNKLAPMLAQNYQVICADLRGYGRSAKPKTDETHAPYAKRAMASDLIQLMNHLGHERFLIGAHDRGARVAHRLAADHPDRVIALALLDIAPTREMYRDATTGFANAYWHWYWLTQKSPFPEKLIAADPSYFWCKKCCSGSAGASPFAKQALAEYLTCFQQPATIHGACEDYRAAISIDIDHDNQDQTKLPMPLLALWGQHGVIEAHFDCLKLWRERAINVQGKALPAGHYLAEEVPKLVLDHWLPFFSSAA